MKLKLDDSLSYSYASPLTGRKYVFQSGAVCDVDDLDVDHIAKSASVIPLPGEEREVLKHARCGNFQLQRYAIENGLDLIPNRLNGMRISLVRAGGIGDILFLGPVISELKKRGANVTLVCSASYTCLGSLIHGVDQVVPISRYLPDQYDIVLKMGGVIESNFLAKNLHAVDCCLQWLNLNSTDRITRLHISQKVQDWATEFCTEKNIDLKRTIAIHTHASSPLRTWKKKFAQELISKLVDKGFSVMFFDSVKIDIEEQEGFFNLSGTLSLIKTISLLKKVFLFIGVDSGLLHVAGSFDVPILMLGGPFDPSLRLKYYKRFTSLWGKSDCSPCFAHISQTCINRNKPSRRCMNRVKVEDVCNEVDLICNGKYQWGRIQII